MRTTVEFDEDTAKAVEALRATEGIGVSEAVNELIRRGLLHQPPTERFVQQTHALGLRIDVSNIADALETLDGPSAR